MKKEKKKSNIASSIGYSLVRPILRLFTLIFVPPKIYYRKRRPKGAYILAGTHTSYFDFMMVGCSTIRPIHFLVKKELMDKKVLGKIVKFLGMIRVDRTTKNPDAMKGAINALESGQIVCLFPEGTINKTDDYIMPFKYGAVSIAKRTGKPIVPFAIIGKPKIFNYHSKVLLGKPIYVKDDDLEKANNKLEEEVIKLIKEGRSYDKKRNKKEK